MHKKTTHYLLILFFVLGTTQAFAMSCHMSIVDITDNMQISTSNDDCHTSNSETDNNSGDCQLCKVCSTSNVSIIEPIKFSKTKNFEIKNYTATNYHPIITEIPTPPPNL